MIRNDTMHDFLKAVDDLEKRKEAITYYNLVKLKTGLSNTTILSVLEYLEAINVLRHRTVKRGEGKIITYKKRLLYGKFKKYIEGC